MSGASAVTSIDSVIWPTWSSKSMRALRSTCTLTPFRISVRKPGKDVCTEYAPGGRTGKLYLPVSLLRNVRTRPVASFVTVTSTPGSTAPDASLIRPSIDPVMRWPNVVSGTNNSKAKIAAFRILIFFSSFIPMLRSLDGKRDLQAVINLTVTA